MNRLAVLSGICFFLVSAHLSAQTSATSTVSKDPSAVALVQQSTTAMGGVAPADSTLTGILAVTAGGSTQTGTFRHLTRGTDQSAEHVVLPDGDRQRIFSRGLGAQKKDSTVQSNSLQWTATAQSSDFPIVYLMKLLQDPSVSIAPASDDTVDGVLSHCVVFTNVYPAPQQSLAALSRRTTCFDAKTNLPTRTSFVSRSAEGAVAGIAMDIHFTDYRNINGVAVPFSIHQYVNGTPWATISIQNVTFNSGLTDADFATE